MCGFFVPVTLTLNLILHLGTVKIYLHTKNEVSRWKHSKVIAIFAPMTLTFDLTSILELELETAKIYVYTTNEVSKWWPSKVIAIFALMTLTFDLDLDTWTWTRYVDLDTWTWTRYCKDIFAYQKWSFLGKTCKSYVYLCLFDLDIWPLTLKLIPDLGTVKIYWHTKNVIPR